MCSVLHPWFRRTVLAVIAGLFLFPGAARAATQDLNCSDFGSRERAQFEMDKFSYDIYELDGDADGRACEWNGSTGWWGWPLSGLALVGGRYFARRKKADHRVIPGIEGLWNNYTFHEDGGVDKVFDRPLTLLALGGVVALPLVGIFRDYVAPRSFTPITINLLVSLLAGVISFSIVSRTNKIDQYR